MEERKYHEVKRRPGEDSIKGVGMVVGPMYAGKSNSLVIAVETYQKNEEDFICFKHKFDDERYGKNEIVSRTGKKTKAFSVKNYKEIEEIIETAKNKKDERIVIIDELHFFGIDGNQGEIDGFIKMLRDFVDKGIKVKLFGLDRDFKTDYFPLTQRLIGDKLIEDGNITYLEAECSIEGCCEKAIYSAKITDDKNVIDVDKKNDEKKEKSQYIATCAQHHNYINKQIDYKNIQLKKKEDIGKNKKDWQNKFEKKVLSQYVNLVKNILKETIKCCGFFSS